MPYIPREMMPAGTAYYHAKRRKRRKGTSMNYPRKLSRAAMARRILILLCIVAAVALIIGVIIGYAAGRHADCTKGQSGQAYIGMTIETE